MKIINGDDLITYVTFDYSLNLIIASRYVDNKPKKVTIKNFSFEQLERFTKLSNDAFKALADVQKELHELRTN